MKKIYSILISLLAVGLFMSGCSKKEATVESNWEKEKKLVVATSGTLFPASYYNDKNELTGYDVEVIKEVAKRLNVKVEFKEYNVDGMLAAVKNQTADLAANDFTLNKKRADKFSLSTPIKYSFSSLIVRKSDDSGIHTLEDLKGKKAAGESSTNYMKIAEKYGAQLVNYSNATNDQYLTDVAKGRTDVIINDYYLQKMSVNALPEIPVKILDSLYFNASQSGFLFTKDNQQLKEKVDQEIDKMKKDGTLKELSEKFFSHDVSVKPTVEIKTKVEVE